VRELKRLKIEGWQKTKARKEMDKAGSVELRNANPDHGPAGVALCHHRAALGNKDGESIPGCIALRDVERAKGNAESFWLDQNFFDMPEIVHTTAGFNFAASRKGDKVIFTRPLVIESTFEKKRNIVYGVQELEAPPSALVALDRRCTISTGREPPQSKPSSPVCREAWLACERWRFCKTCGRAVWAVASCGFHQAAVATGK
jgi:hypothetical protein